MSAERLNKKEDKIEELDSEALANQKHISFLALVQRHYKNVDLAFNYATQNGEKLVGSIDITGDVTATITYTYNAASNNLEKEEIIITAPFAATITTSWTYDVAGDVETESRTVS